MIHQIIFSGHVSPDTSKNVELESVERIHNYCEASGVTGLKLYTDGSFLCISEGSRNAVESLQKAYQGDERLSDIVVLLKGEIKQPEFQDFQIGFCKSDTQIDVPRCFTLTYASLEKALPKSVSNDIKILTKTFARVNNLLVA